jgi:26S proteasome regulatory subunit N12
MSSNQVNETTTLYKLLKKEWDLKNPNLNKCGDMLSRLKVSLTQLSFLPTNDSFTKSELIVARDILEIGALHSIAVKDIPSFERYLAQLKCYYFDYQLVFHSIDSIFCLLIN